MAALIIDSISWASIGIPVLLHSSASNRGRLLPRAVSELSVDTLLRHALSHYIPDPIPAKPLDRMARSQRPDRKTEAGHETSRSRPPHHHHGEPEARPRLRGRRR